jgi:MacB-like periplasmic core domain
LSRAQRSAGRVLVIGEITLGVVLVTGAALAARTLFNIEHVRPGFEPRTWYGEYRARIGAPLESYTADSRAVTPGYLPAMGARLLEGRQFSPQDHADAPNVVIVDDMLARSTWPGESALGKRIDAQHMTRTGTPFEFVDSVVVGVVEHVHSHSLIKEVRPQIYPPFAQNTRANDRARVPVRLRRPALIEALDRAADSL